MPFILIPIIASLFAGAPLLMAPATLAAAGFATTGIVAGSAAALA